MSARLSPPKTMPAIVQAEGKTEPEALSLAEMPTPNPGPDEVLIQVAAAGVNRPDLVQRKGQYPPPPGASSLLGLEVSGCVAAVGSGVSQWHVGDPVCALLPGGGYAGYAVAHQGSVLPVPKGLSMLEAAAVPEVAFTVMANVFDLGRLQPGETLLVHGANSGIGMFAIQMAKAHGAKVVGTVRRPELLDRLAALGADALLNTATEDWVQALKELGGADVVLDMLGGEMTARNLRAMNAGGRLVQIAFLTGRLAEVDLARIMTKGLTLTGSTLRARPPEEKARLAMLVRDRLWPWLEDGQVQVPVDATFPLAEAAQAHQHLEDGGHMGKVVLRVADL